MITHRSYQFIHSGQISIAKDNNISKAIQIQQIKAKYGIIPRYSGKTQEFYI